MNEIIYGNYGSDIVLIKDMEDMWEFEVNNKTQLSAWQRGVYEYAWELIEALLEDAEYCFNNGCDTENLCYCDEAIFERRLLNGARDWKQYSEGGCSLICDIDIINRVCTPSEIKRLSRFQYYGAEWIAEVQPRALHQASEIVKRLRRDALRSMFE